MGEEKMHQREKLKVLSKIGLWEKNKNASGTVSVLSHSSLKVVSNITQRFDTVLEHDCLILCVSEGVGQYF